MCTGLELNSMYPARNLKQEQLNYKGLHICMYSTIVVEICNSYGQFNRICVGGSKAPTMPVYVEHSNVANIA